MVKVRDDYPLTAAGELDQQAWLARTFNSNHALDLEVIEQALELGQLPAADGLTEANMQCFDEGLQMAEIVAKLQVDPSTVAACLIFPAVAYADLPIKQVADALGSEVAELVRGTLAMKALNIDATKANQQVANGEQLDRLRKMLLAMASDVRVVLIKLAEHLCCLREAKSLSEAERVAVASQAQDLFAPLANRLGVGQIKWELEDLAFRYLDPATYKRIAKLLDERRVDRERYIERVIGTLQTSLAEDQVEADVHGRVKHIFSIWRKMQRKNLDYQQIYDVRAVRILVDDLQSCYMALGTVHRLWQHIHHEFDDYIATPKENGYRSLHTAVVGPEGKTVEVQIRTKQMHQDSELGVAAHWRYKEGGSRDASYEKKLVWLRQLLDWQEEVADANVLMDELKTKVVEERVYVLTPKGDVLDLPQGATPLDFAYNIHTSIGHRCRGAKVNGRIVPLTYKINTGEKIEIITGSQENPSRDWMNSNLGYIVSSRARSKIQAWFKHQNKDSNAQEGRVIFERELQRLGITESAAFETMASELNYQSTEDMLAALATGDLRMQAMLNAGGIKVPAKDATKSVIPFDVAKKSSHKHAARPGEITIQGVGNLLTTLAKCCKPLPGDPVIGYITQGRGVTVHRKDCQNIEAVAEEREARLVDVEWGGTEQTYPVDLAIEAHDRSNLMRDVTNCLSNEKINLLALNSRVDQTQGLAYAELSIEVADLSRLARILDKLQQLPMVISVRRRS